LLRLHSICHGELSSEMFWRIYLGECAYFLFKICSYFGEKFSIYSIVNFDIRDFCSSLLTNTNISGWVWQTVSFKKNLIKIWLNIWTVHTYCSHATMDLNNVVCVYFSAADVSLDVWYFNLSRATSAGLRNANSFTSILSCWQWSGDNSGVDPSPLCTNLELPLMAHNCIRFPSECFGVAVAPSDSASEGLLWLIGKVVVVCIDSEVMSPGPVPSLFLASRFSIGWLNLA